MRSRRDITKRAEREKFRKRSKNLFKKANELSRMCNTDLYLILYREGKYHTYSSTDRQGWPPSSTDLVGEFLERQVFN